MFAKTQIVRQDKRTSLPHLNILTPHLGRRAATQEVADPAVDTTTGGSLVEGGAIGVDRVKGAVRSV